MRNTQKQISIIDYESIWFETSLILIVVGFIVKEFYLLLYFIGTIHIFIFFHHFYLSRKLQNWIKTEGIYEVYYLKKVSIINASRNIQEKYQPYCEYNYCIDNKKYFSHTLSIIKNDFSFHKEFLAEANMAVKRKSEMKKVTLYYNPKNYSESVLVRGMSSGLVLRTYLIGISGLVALFLGLYNSVYS